MMYYGTRRNSGYADRFDNYREIAARFASTGTCGHEIAKGGRVVTFDFVQGVAATFGDGVDAVMEAIIDFLASLPLAGRTPNRIFLSHSLPGPRTFADFNAEDLKQTPTRESLEGHGTAYALVWGRYQTPAILDELAETLDADLFIAGHQPQEDGYAVVHDRLLMLASDHNHGVFLPFDLRRKLTIDDLVRLVRPFAAVA